MQNLLVLSKAGDEIDAYDHIVHNMNWYVIVASTKKKTEFYQSMSYLGVKCCEMCSSRDEFNRRIKQLARQKWRLVLSNIDDVHNVFKNHKVYLLADGKIKRDKQVNKIPLIFHQIWFGPNKYDALRDYLFKKNKQLATKHGFEYKLWTNKEFNFENLPLTWKRINKAISMGKKQKISRWAQVADLARYELLHRHGGVYMDSLFETSDEFFTAVKSKSQRHKFITANEDPCGLKCNVDGMLYMSNSFFGNTIRHPILKNLLQEIVKNKIDFKNDVVSATTGPYFFRSGFENHPVFLFKTKHIYPFMVYTVDENRSEEDSTHKCVLDKPAKNAIKVKDVYVMKNCQKRMYPKSLAVFHNGFGASWIKE